MPADPSQRRHVVRSTVRVLLVDEHERVLMFEDSDAGVGARWWILPGGGIDPGESDLEAVLREVREETGLCLRPTEVVGPLAHRHVVHGYSDQVVDQDDTFYGARVAAFEVSTEGFTAEEQITVLQHRWWSRTDLASTDEEVWPLVLDELWDLLEAPPSAVVELADVEESSVPVA
ncbi:NUDIX hydrolase [Luteipulveratus halotolerans]|uniref:NUDIX hydrolase n=1 Tax=Luteipulveratus halotolerans TaxID=1631356 RepID=A0A0L6CNH0_9MICO|nr:NUDIX hydrolase [Luteipulveratus halotolerans]